MSIVFVLPTLKQQLVQAMCPDINIDPDFFQILSSKPENSINTFQSEQGQESFIEFYRNQYLASVANYLLSSIQKCQKNSEKIHVYETLYAVLVKLLDAWRRLSCPEMKVVIQLFYENTVK